jgi:hypothetical protein
MSTIVTRSGKGSALTFTEMDSNFTNINTDKLENVSADTTPQLGGNLDVNGNSIVSASGGNIAITPDTTGSIVLDGLNWPQADGTANYYLQTNGSGQLQWGVGGSGLADVVDDTTPQLGGNLDVNGNSIVSASAGNIAITPDTTGLVVLDGLSWPPVDGSSGQVLYTNGAASLAWKTVTEATGSELENVVEDTTPQLGGDLDVQSSKITTSTTNGNLTLEANGTGSLVINAGTGVNVKAANNIFTDTASTDINFAATGYLNMNSITYFDAGIEENVYLSTTTTGTYAPAATDGSIHYVAMTGSMTINAFTSPAAGQTISLFFDGSGGSYTLTLGASILSPGGTLAITDGGYDIVTITCVDDVTPVYIATAVNDFQ